MRLPSSALALVLSGCSLLVLGACQKSGDAPAPDAADAGAAVSTENACPDDGPRLEGTGLCVGRSVNYLDPALASAPGDLPEGCSWTMNETLMIGDEALLYQAATCKGVTTKLAFAGGAKSASITYETSATGVGGADQEVIRLFTAPPEDPQANIKQIIAEDPAAKDCIIRPAGVDIWPADALVIAPTEEARAKMPRDEPVAACGVWGLDEDSSSYWRVRQGYAWFFQLGQEALDFSPHSMTLLRKGPDGTWAVAE